MIASNFYYFRNGKRHLNFSGNTQYSIQIQKLFSSYANIYIYLCETKCDENYKIIFGEETSPISEKRYELKKQLHADCSMQVAECRLLYVTDICIVTLTGQ